MYCEKLDIDGLIITNKNGILHINDKPIVHLKKYINDLPITTSVSGDIYIENVFCESINCDSLEVEKLK